MSPGSAPNMAAPSLPAALPAPTRALTPASPAPTSTSTPTAALVPAQSSAPAPTAPAPAPAPAPAAEDCTRCAHPACPHRVQSSAAGAGAGAG
ncbi:2-oxoglutarate dehydrogenase, E2 component, dihydrolipoamide succinyltransferase, partial [archaeon]